MPEKFSAMQRIGDLNDYISPSQGCVIKTEVGACYDKELEAARDDFVFQVDSDSERVTEVDSVLTTWEVLDVIQIKSADFTSLDDDLLKWI